jgi:hypothetical protein
VEVVEVPEEELEEEEEVVLVLAEVSDTLALLGH